MKASSSTSSVSIPMETVPVFSSSREDTEGVLAASSEEEPRFVAACQNILQYLGEGSSGTDQFPDMVVRSSSAAGHDVTRLERILRRLPGISEVDDPFHAILGAKPVFAEAKSVQHPSSVNEPHDRLAQFQSNSFPHSAADLGADLFLTSLMMGAGVTAYLAGRMESRKAKHEKKNLRQKQSMLQEKRKAFISALQSAHRSPHPDANGRSGARLHRARLLETQVAILDWELERIAIHLKHNGKEKAVGDGSAAAGLVSVIKGTVDIVTKPLAHFLESGASVAAASATGFVALPAAPLAAASGLYMGVNSKKLSKAQLKEHKEKLKAAIEELGLLEAALPADVRADYKRFFADGKWKSRTDQMTSFNKLMTWFVTGMSGYTAGMTGLSVAKIVALLAAGAVVADLTISGGVLAATSVLMIGTYGFLKHRSRLHEQGKLSESDSPEFDRDFMLNLFARGGTEGILQSVEVLRFVEAKEERRQDFLHALATREGLRFDGIKTHSTDTEDVRRKREEQRAAGNQTKRFLVAHGLTSQNMHALAKGAKGFVSTLGHGAKAPEAKRQAKIDFANRTDFLTRTRLAALLDSPSHSDLAGEYMLNEIDAQLDFLDKRLQKKIDMVDMNRAESASLPMRFLPDEHAERAHDFESHVEEYFRDVAADLLNDKVLFEQGTALRRTLRQWREEGGRNRETMAEIRKRFLSFQRWKVHVQSESDEPVLKTWARYLMDEAPKDYKESRGRLHVTVLDAAPLRVAAEKLSHEPKVKDFAHGWEWYRSDIGAPQIKMLRKENFSLQAESERLQQRLEEINASFRIET